MSRLVSLAVLALLVGLAALPAAGQITEEEARDLFQRLGCTSCHTQGGTAPPFDEVVALFEQWRTQYASIDEAVAAEVVVFGQRYDTYEAMMQQMAAFTGKSLEDIQPLYDYFLQVFQGQAAEQPPEETEQQTPAEEAPEATTPPAEEGVAEQPPAEEAPAEQPAEGGAGYALIAGILLAIIVVGTALLLSKRS